VLLIACYNDEQKSTDSGNDKSAKPAEAIITKSCYQSINNKDTVLLDLTVADKAVSGNLQYNFFGKDKNKGTFSGEMRGDTILVNYIFTSEGTTSTRQVIFLKKGNTLVEGYGEMEEKGNKMIFKNINTIDFSKSIVLKQIDCK
jgi:hypothetical protein